MSRVLVLAAYYPPSGESGARRPYHVTQALVGAGHQVKVVVTGGNPNESGPRSSGETVQFLGQPAETARFHPRLIGLWKMMPWVQDAHDGYKSAVETAIRAFASEGPTVLYVSAPPASLARMAIDSVKYCDGVIKVVLEFRDPWRLNTYSPLKSIQRAILTRYRDNTVSQADSIVAVTESVAAHLGQLFPELPRVVALNGIPDKLLAQPPITREDDHEIPLLHLGEFYLGRDPTPVLESLARLRGLKLASADRITVDFVGEVAETPSGATTDLFERLELESVGRLSPRVPHEAAVGFLERAGIFLLLAQDQPLQVPNKLFEYLAYRRPILAVVDRGGETEKILHATGHGETTVHPGATKATMDKALGRALTLAASRASVGSESALRELTTSRQLRSVVRLVTDIGISMSGDVPEAEE